MCLDDRMISEQGLHTSYRQEIQPRVLWLPWNPGHYKVCFHPQIKLRQTHTSTETSVCLWTCSPHPPLNGIPPLSRWGTGEGPLESQHSIAFFEFCQLALQALSKVTYYLCGCENTLCSSRVCEITWNRFESCSGKVIAVRISCVTKPYPGLNDVVYIQLHSTTAEAICGGPKSPHSIVA